MTKSPPPTPGAALRAQITSKLHSLRRVIERTYGGSAEYGSFARNGGGEIVPGPHLLLDELDKLLSAALPPEGRQPEEKQVEAYIKVLPWSAHATDDERSLVAGNIRAFAMWLRHEIPGPSTAEGRQEPEDQRYRALILWALGESKTDAFPSLPDDWPRRKFYWRKELRRRFDAIDAEGRAHTETPPDNIRMALRDCLDVIEPLRDELRKQGRADAATCCDEVIAYSRAALSALTTPAITIEPGYDIRGQRLEPPEDQG